MTEDKHDIEARELVELMLSLQGKSGLYSIEYCGDHAGFARSFNKHTDDPHLGINPLRLLLAAALRERAKGGE